MLPPFARKFKDRGGRGPGTKGPSRHGSNAISPLNPGIPANPGLTENAIRDLEESILIEGVNNTFNPAAGAMYFECQYLKDLTSIVNGLSGDDQKYPQFTSFGLKGFLTCQTNFLFWPAIVLGENGMTFSTTESAAGSFISALKVGASADNQAWHFGPLLAAKFHSEATAAAHLFQCDIQWDLTEVMNQISLRFSKDEIDEEDPLQAFLVGCTRSANNASIVLDGYVSMQYMAKDRSVNLAIV